MVKVGLITAAAAVAADMCATAAAACCRRIATWLSAVVWMLLRPPPQSDQITQAAVVEAAVESDSRRGGGNLICGGRLLKGPHIDIDWEWKAPINVIQFTQAHAATHLRRRFAPIALIALIFYAHALRQKITAQNVNSNHPPRLGALPART